MDVDDISRFKGGWYIGDFMPSVLRTPGFEVGLKVHYREEHIERHRHDVVTEYNLLVAGRMRVNGRTLEEGAVFVLNTGEIVEAEVLTDVAKVICVKVPSIPSDKTVVPK